MLLPLGGRSPRCGRSGTVERMPGKPGRVGVAALAVLASASVTSPAAAKAVSTQNAGGRATSQGRLGGAGDSGTAHIAWDKLQNPILSYANSGIRDPSIRLVEGAWPFFSPRLLATGRIGGCPPPPAGTCGRGPPRSDGRNLVSSASPEAPILSRGKCGAAPTASPRPPAVPRPEAVTSGRADSGSAASCVIFSALRSGSAPTPDRSRPTGQTRRPPTTLTLAVKGGFDG
jgi:hypothetical protein